MLELENQEFYELELEIFSKGNIILWIYDEGLGYCAIINGDVIDKEFSRHKEHYNNKFEALTHAWNKYTMRKG
jgi:hypothetical protein